MPPMNQPTIKKLSLAIWLRHWRAERLWRNKSQGLIKVAMGHAAPATDSPLAICYSNLVTDPCPGMKYGRQ
jgi:hypothetical protein